MWPFFLNLEYFENTKEATQQIVSGTTTLVFTHLFS